MAPIKEAALLLLLALSCTDAANNSHCGRNFGEAKANCNSPCVHVGIDDEHCPSGQWCFGPDLPCTPPSSDSNGGGVGDVMLSDRGPGSTATKVDLTVTGDDIGRDEGGEAPVVATMMTMDSAHDDNAADVAGDNEEEPIAMPMEFAMLGTDDNAADAAAANSSTPVPTSDRPTTISPTTRSPTSAAPTTSPSTETPAPTAAPTTEALRLAEERRGMDNPSNHYCGFNWDQAKNDCNNDINAIPCPPGNLPCLPGQICLAVGIMCTPKTLEPTISPSEIPTTTSPTTASPTSSPIADDDPSNAFFCGADQADADDNCGDGSRKWCRYGIDEECPDGQHCFVTTSGCSAAAMNYTFKPTEMPTATPTTESPTEDPNPYGRYCSDSWKDANYDGECGMPCPSGSQLDCPHGQFCYSGMTGCTKTLKIGVSTSWCGATFEDMSDTCHQECPEGRDDECPEGETCWGDSPCALLDEAREALEAKKKMMWCASSYKHLVEHCPKPCPSGSSDECGKDDDGNDMACFDMSEEEQACNTTGVGIREPVDPNNLWCGTSWNHVLENCPKKCPEGTDEECGGNGMICYDLTGNEPMICKTEGFGVKKKGDPNKRFCGDSYNHMMEFCPMRCPNGDECPGSSVCFEESPCELEGQTAPNFVKIDTSKMFCGSDYGEAATCGTPCPGGSNAECGGGQRCWAEVECNPWAASAVTQQADESSSMVVEVTVDIDADDAQVEESELESQPAPAPEPELAPAPESEPQPAVVEVTEINADDAQVDEAEPVAESDPKLQSAPAPEPKPAQASKPEPQPAPKPEPEKTPPPVESKPDPPAPQPEPQLEPQPEPKPTPPAPQPQPEPEPEPTPPAESKPTPPAESKPTPPAEPKPTPPAEPKPAPPAEPKPAPPAESKPNPPAESKPSPPVEPARAPKPVTEPETQGNPFEDMDDASASDPSSSVAVDNLRMALYGLSDLSAAHLIAWETVTAIYVENFYNSGSTGDSIRDSVLDMSAEFDVTSLNLSVGRRSMLRAQKQRKASESAFLLAYTQTADYSTEGGDVTLEEVLQHPFQSSARRAEYVAYLKAADPELFGDVTSVSAVILPEPMVPREISSAVDSSILSPASPPTPVFPSAPSPAASPSGRVYSKDFYCHNSGEACPSGECVGEDLCMFVPDGTAPIGPFSGGNSAPSPDSAANLLSSVFDGSFVRPKPATPANTGARPSPPTPPIVNNLQPQPQPKPQSQSQPTPSVAQTPGNLGMASEATNNYDGTQSLTSVTFGPTEVSRLEMTLSGIGLRSAREVFEWQYLTALYVQAFYNDAPALTGDYVQDSVYAVAAAFEVTGISYEADSQAPSTTFVFTQTTQYTTVDPGIETIDIVTQPFSTSTYRDNYVDFLRSSLAETFGLMNNVPDVAQARPSKPTVLLTDTFYCAAQLPVDCDSADSCENDSDCPQDQDCLIEPLCAAAEDMSEQQQYFPLQQSTPAQQTPVQQPAPVQRPTPVQQPTPKQRPTSVQKPTPAQRPTPVQQAAPVSVPKPTPMQQAAPIYSACNLCSPNQVGLNSPINFNGRLTDCAEAYDFMAKNYNEGSMNCIGAQKALSGACCQDQVDTGNNNDSSMAMMSQSSPTYPAPSNPSGAMVGGNQPTGPYTATADSPSSPTDAYQPSVSSPSTNDDSPSSPTKITVTVTLEDNPAISESLTDSESEMRYPSNSYYCGTSLESAANSCSIPCPSSKDNECPGDLQCFGNTECMNRGSFYCGTSWLDASDKCSKPCPNGDALECDEGEACFAWTSCENTDSFYCGVSFEDATSNCALACPTRSSLDCPKGQGCFAYTTCEGEISPPHEVDPLNVPMNDNFCGETPELASSTCSIACQSGEDSECPGDLQCYEGTGCSSRDSFWCGSTWMEAAEMCTQPCSSGSSDECPGNESCFAHTGCQANLFFCGETFEDTSSSCGKPCASRSSNECPDGRWCFAFVTACASEVIPFSPTRHPTSRSYNSNIANTQWDIDAVIQDEGSVNTDRMDGSNQHGKPNWHTQWSNNEVNSSSTRSASFISIAIAFFSLALLITALL